MCYRLRSYVMWITCLASPVILTQPHSKTLSVTLVTRRGIQCYCMGIGGYIGWRGRRVIYLRYFFVSSSGENDSERRRIHPR